MKYDDEKYEMNLLILLIKNFFFRKNDEFLMENRHILYHMIDLRQTHIEQFNMLLILLIVSSILF